MPAGEAPGGPTKKPRAKRGKRGADGRARAVGARIGRAQRSNTTRAGLFREPHPRAKKYPRCLSGVVLGKLPGAKGRCRQYI
jgi:hypothetical protein